VCLCACMCSFFVVVGMGCLFAQVRRWGNILCVKFQFAFMCDLVKIFQFSTQQPLTLVFRFSIARHLFMHVGMLECCGYRWLCCYKL